MQYVQVQMHTHTYINAHTIRWWFKIRLIDFLKRKRAIAKLCDSAQTCGKYVYYLKFSTHLYTYTSVYIVYIEETM